ncbi:MAG: MBL fold metallo-hydrolase [Chloroflexi bacterium]|nr:MBL fold metallo-hydrolase [Chloroflexota bacterium]
MKIIALTLGPVETNCYIVADEESNEAIVIDPSWDGEQIAKAALDAGLKIKEIWLTHAHFDHIGGIASLVNALPEKPPVYLHADDYDLWKSGGGGARFGIQIDLGPEPIRLEDGQILKVGKYAFESRHTPGHRPGHSVFYSAEAGILFSGDLIFYRSVGRTDLPGGNWATLEKSIHEKIYTLPNETRVFSGHGDETSVGDEKINNQFIKA